MTSHSRTYAVVFGAFFLLSPLATQAATLGLSPSNSTASAGTSITETVEVFISDRQAINAISGELSFPKDLLQVVSISKVSSILTLWVVEPTYSNTDGTISFSGIVPNPGYSGSRGRVLSIKFRAKESGTATVLFSPLSQVLANDGSGTNILKGTQPATITIAATQPQPEPTPTAPINTILVARITSSTHPDETKWYTRPHAIFDWTNAQGVSAVRLGYDKDADGVPGVLYSDPISHKELDLVDGIWYFHVQERDASGWGPVSTYRVQIDTVVPAPFTVTFVNGTTTASGNPIGAQFAATDALSGIDHYQLSIDGKKSTVSAEEGSKPYAVSASPGTHLLVVQAYDKAGNVTSAEGKFSVITEGASSSSPLFAFGWLAVNYLSLILVLLAVLGTLLFGAWYIRVHFSAYRYRLNRRLGITHNHIHKEFDDLKEAVTDELSKLEKARSARALTREEERLITRFRKLLDQSEQRIEREVEDLSK